MGYTSTVTEFFELIMGGLQNYYSINLIAIVNDIWQKYISYVPVVGTINIEACDKNSPVHESGCFLKEDQSCILKLMIRE